MSTETENRIAVAEQAIAAAGFTLSYVEFCEDAETPGLLGAYVGKTHRDTRRVKIATHRRSRHEIAATLAHELHHVLDPEWDCGNRPVIAA